MPLPDLSAVFAHIERSRERYLEGLFDYLSIGPASAPTGSASARWPST